MGWPQPPSPVQTDNSTAVVGVINKTIVPRRIKSMDIRFYWLRCREAQGQFRWYWPPGPRNLGDYSTKVHPPIHHLAMRKQPYIIDIGRYLYQIMVTYHNF